MALFSSSKRRKGAEAARFLTIGKEISCPQCEGNLFRQGRAQLNTAAMSLFDLDWANKSATTLICTQCGFISWYIDEPTRIE